MHLTLQHFLMVSAVLFGLGLFTVMTRKNAVGILLGVELILNAAALNFVAFEHYVAGGVGGQVFTVFIIILAASEAAAQIASLLLGGAAPDTGVLVGLQCVFQAIALHGAFAADFLGTVDLYQRVAGGADGEEQVGISVSADGKSSPGVVSIRQCKT